MRDLNYALKQLCDRNRDGSNSTQRDRQRVLDRIGKLFCAVGTRAEGAARRRAKF